jgi:hypothetical protein
MVSFFSEKARREERGKARRERSLFLAGAAVLNKDIYFGKYAETGFIFLFNITEYMPIINTSYNKSASSCLLI